APDAFPMRFIVVLLLSQIFFTPTIDKEPRNHPALAG
ncbi:MAG: hypothetical protein AUK64_2382, partial [bacterium P201]